MNTKRERGAATRVERAAASEARPLDAYVREFADPRFYARREDLRKAMIQRNGRIDQDHLNRGIFSSSGRLSFRLEARMDYLRGVLEARVQATVEGYETAGAVMDVAGLEQLNAALRTIVDVERTEFIKESTRDADNSGLGFDLLQNFHAAIRRDCSRELGRSINLARSEKARLELVRIRSALATTSKSPPRLPPAMPTAGAGAEIPETSGPDDSASDVVGDESRSTIADAMVGSPHDRGASRSPATGESTGGEVDRAKAAWQKIEPTGVPLVGWKAITGELKITCTRASKRQLREWNKQTAGPFVYLSNRPTVDAARLKAWLSQLSDGGSAAVEREAGRERSISELSKRDDVGLSELGMHSTRRRAAPKPKRADLDQS